jgi:uncharacterized protein (DUF2236 family)
LAAYHRDQAALARLLGVPRDLVPDRPEDFRRLVEETLADGTLRVGDDARAIARSVLEAPTGPWGKTAGLLTAGLLPAPLREDFGLPWDESREHALQGLEARVRAARRAAGTPVDAGRDAR